jgi:hypothetical protein
VKAPLAPFPYLPALLVLALGGVCLVQSLAAGRQARTLDLVRSEIQLLEQENRLLRQQLEAERILAAAQARAAAASSNKPPLAP